MFFYSKKDTQTTLNFVNRTNFMALKSFSLNLSDNSLYLQDFQSKSLLLAFDLNLIYEIDVDLGEILKITSIGDKILTPYS